MHGELRNVRNRKQMKIAALVISILFIAPVFAQQDSSKTKTFQLYSIELHTGTNGYSPENISNKEFENSFNTGPVLFIDPSQNSTFPMTSVNFDAYFGSNVTFKVNSHNRFLSGMKVNIGLSKSNFNYLSSSFHSEQLRTTDTFKLAGSPRIVIVDTLSYTSKNIGYNSRQLALEFGVSKSIDLLNRLSVTPGLSASTGWNYDNYAIESYFENENERTTIVENNQVKSEVTQYFVGESEHKGSGAFPAKSGFAATIMTPVELSLRLGKKESQGGNMSVFAAMTPSYTFVNIPEYKWVDMFVFRQTFGVRYIFAKS